MTNEQTSGTHYDATSNVNNGTQVRNDDTAGNMANAQTFDGTVTYDYVNVADPVNGSLDIGSGVNLTVSAWVKTTQGMVAGRWPAMVRKMDDDGSPADGYSLILHSSNLTPQWYFEIYDGGAVYTADGSNNIADGNWHYIVGVRSGSTLISYQDGNVSSTNPGGSSGDLSNTYPLRMASDCSGAPGAGLVYQGSLDEVRVSNIARSACWIQTEYNNMNWPNKTESGANGFVTIGAEQGAAAPTAISILSFKATGDGGDVVVAWTTAHGDQQLWIPQELQK